MCSVLFFLSFTLKKVLERCNSIHICWNDKYSRWFSAEVNKTHTNDGIDVMSHRTIMTNHLMAKAFLTSCTFSIHKTMFPIENVTLYQYRITINRFSWNNGRRSTISIKMCQTSWITAVKNVNHCQCNLHTHTHKFHLNFVEFHWNSAFYDFSANVLKTIATKR